VDRVDLVIDTVIFKILMYLRPYLPLDKAMVIANLTVVDTSDVVSAY